ncbi:hypothetical protein [Marinigracilibium pacificum]|uniref:Uncharacterized protein n=1 Tax=Marinigracilibium pacificum TaxID=2729599 RepID=A0A848IY24_9BACT|nr:hypothetical protein [Marinigracilibium pacificum]NMM47180.1 hypothetical protein [Marinigracilibium pacificum]
MLKVRYYIYENPMDILGSVNSDDIEGITIDNFSGSELSYHLKKLLEKETEIQLIIENKKTSEPELKELIVFLRSISSFRKNIIEITHANLSSDSEVYIKKFCANVKKTG